MTKILGYENREINKLYITSTTFVVLASLLLTIPICNSVMGMLCAEIFSTYPGYFPYYVSGITFVKMFAGMSNVAKLTIGFARKILYNRRID